MSKCGQTFQEIQNGELPIKLPTRAKTYDSITVSLKEKVIIVRKNRQEHWILFLTLVRTDVENWKKQIKLKRKKPNLKK